MGKSNAKNFAYAAVRVAKTWKNKKNHEMSTANAKSTPNKH